MSRPEGDRELWRAGGFACLMVTCCAGAELQVRHQDPDGDIVLRELYPTKSDLYERANDLRAQYERHDAPRSG